MTNEELAKQLELDMERDASQLPGGIPAATPGPAIDIPMGQVQEMFSPGASPEMKSPHMQEFGAPTVDLTKRAGENVLPTDTELQERFGTTTQAIGRTFSDIAGSEDVQSLVIQLIASGAVPYGWPRALRLIGQLGIGGASELMLRHAQGFPVDESLFMAGDVGLENAFAEAIAVQTEGAIPGAIDRLGRAGKGIEKIASKHPKLKQGVRVAKVIGQGASKLPGLIRHGADPYGAALPKAAAGLGPMRAPFANKQYETTKRIMERFAELSQAQGKYGQLTPAQGGHAQGVDMLEELVHSSLASRGMVMAERYGARDLAKTDVTMRRNTLPVDMTLEQVGEGLQLAHMGGLARAKLRAGIIFNRVNNLMSQRNAPMVDITRTKRNLAPELEDITSGLNPEKAERIRRIMDFENEVPYSTARQMSTDLMEFAGQTPLGDATLRAEKGLALKMTVPIQEEILLAIRKVDPAAAAEYSRGMSIWRDEVAGGTFGNDSIVAMMNNNPHMVAKSLIDSKDPVLITHAWDATRDFDRSGKKWEAVEGAWLDKHIFNATDPDTGTISFNKMLNSINDQGLQDKSVLRAVFRSKKSQSNMEELLKSVEAGAGAERAATEAKQGGGPVVAFAMLQVAGLSSGFTGAQSLAAPLIGFQPAIEDKGKAFTAAAVGGMILFGPRKFGKLMMKPKNREWLTTGLEAAPGSMVAKRSIIVLMEDALKDRLLLNVDEEEKARSYIKYLSKSLQEDEKRKKSRVSLLNEPEKKTMEQFGLRRTVMP